MYSPCMELSLGHGGVCSRQVDLAIWSQGEVGVEVWEMPVSDGVQISMKEEEGQKAEGGPWWGWWPSA